MCILLNRVVPIHDSESRGNIAQLGGRVTQTSHRQLPPESPEQPTILHVPTVQIASSSLQWFCIRADDKVSRLVMWSIAPM